MFDWIFHELLSFLKKQFPDFSFFSHEELHIKFETKSDKIKTHLMEGATVLY